MSLPNYLQSTKNGWFRYRRAIPSDVHCHFKKKIYIECLHTRDLNEAKKQSHAISVQFNENVERARLSLARRSERMLRSADIDHVSQRFEAMLLYSDDVERSQKLSTEELREHKALIHEGAAQTAEALYAKDTSVFQDDYIAFAEAEGLRINPRWSHFERFALGMMSAQARAYQALEARISGNPIATPKLPPSVRSADDIDDIEMLVDHWKKRQRVSIKTGIEIDSVVKRLGDFAKIRRVSQIDEMLPSRFRDWLLDHGNMQRAKPGQAGAPLCVATVKKLMRLLSAAFQFAVDDKKLKNNPFNGLKFPKANDSTEVKAFTVEQLNIIYQSPVYTSKHRPVGGAGEAAFWMPLFGLFAGGRETELGQPLLSDIGCENGIYYINVTDKGENQSLKTEASRRRIPLHSKLIEIGFLDYIDWLKQRGEKELFPELRPDCKGTLLGNWSKWFNRYLDGLGIDQRGLNFHSFRHSLKYFGRVSGMPEEILDRLQGHTPENVGSKYGGAFPLSRLSSTLEMLTVDGLQIGHLRWRPPKD